MIIQELAAQATSYCDTLDIADSYTYNQIWQREFAQLVIQECVGIVQDAVDHREPASTYVSKIKQHFGVEL